MVGWIGVDLGMERGGVEQQQCNVTDGHEPRSLLQSLHTLPPLHNNQQPPPSAQQPTASPLLIDLHSAFLENMSDSSDSELYLQAGGCRKKLIFESSDEMGDEDKSGWLKAVEGMCVFKKKFNF